ncbi:MAG: glycosyltransferase [Gemmatimonadetes bacterium]|nr:glycosyltransferase [Gemmatimonadota bacterium]
MLSGTPRLTVIIPARNCPGMLRASIAGVFASTLPREAYELIVVDDASTDGETQAVARAQADRVVLVREPSGPTATRGPLGPGGARNLGAQVAQAPLLLFVDSDVVVAPSTLAGFVDAFEAHPDAAAIFGAYDTAPAAPGLVSQYRNLLHHYVHATNPGDATTFWAGCGGVRREAFLAAGGFDAVRYPRPQIEDIELGQRLRARGHRVLLLPHLQGKHLKKWSFMNMVRTDLRERAIPWMSLVLDAGDTMQDGPLNLQIGEKVRAVLSALCVGFVLLAAVLWDARWLLAALACFAVVLWGNAPLLRWYATQRGVIFAAAVAPLRLVYYLVSVSGAAWAILTHRPVRDRAAPPPLTSTVATPT